VRDGGALLGGGFGRPNIHVLVDLPAVGADDLAIDGLRKQNGKRCLAGGGGAKHNDERGGSALEPGIGRGLGFGRWARLCLSGAGLRLDDAAAPVLTSPPHGG